MARLVNYSMIDEMTQQKIDLQKLKEQINKEKKQMLWKYGLKRQNKR